MGIEGSIELDLYLRAGVIGGAAVRSSRPLRASRLLEGKSVAAARATVPLLFSICARAQSVAAAHAIEAALGATATAEVTLERELRVAGECIQEYAWRILLDLPALLGDAPQAAAFAELGRTLRGLLSDGARQHPRWDDAPRSEALDRWRAVADVLSRLLRDQILGMEGGAWLELGTAAALCAWFESCETGAARGMRRLWPSPLGRSAVHGLPHAAADHWARELGPAIAGNPGFVAAPTWRENPAETGALARCIAVAPVRAALRELGNTATVRLLARLAELALLERRLAVMSRGEQAGRWTSAARLGQGAGLSAVETARGLLLHYVEVGTDETVVKYRIVAPTEWNFHPEGSFVRGLEGFAVGSAEDARRAAALMAHALDPCVAYRVEVFDA